MRRSLPIGMLGKHLKSRKMMLQFFTLHYIKAVVVGQAVERWHSVRVGQV